MIKNLENNLIEPSILFSNEHWVIVNKPSGWLSVSGSAQSQLPVLKKWLLSRLEEVYVVHRLDVETSGVMVFARTQEYHSKLSRWFETRKIKKTYICLAKGSSHVPVLRMNEPVFGKPAQTQAEVIEDYQGVFLAKAMPYTGRRHQIRIHFSKSGFPLLGDLKYGGSSEILCKGQNIMINRVALHASEIVFPSGESYQADLPEDFKNWIKTLKQGN